MLINLTRSKSLSIIIKIKAKFNSFKLLSFASEKNNLSIFEIDEIYYKQSMPSVVEEEQSKKGREIKQNEN